MSAFGGKASSLKSASSIKIAAAYGGREEIVDAVQRLLREQALKTR
jgi:undecaprenyl pyrophosphate synthase